LRTEVYCAWDDGFQRKMTFMVSVPDPHSWSSGFDYRTGDLSCRLQALFSTRSFSLSLSLSLSSGKCWNNVRNYAVGEGVIKGHGAPTTTILGTRNSLYVRWPLVKTILWWWWWW
jgi:hypothetical protein